jgi:superfamily II DNA or RNA helicase
MSGVVLNESLLARIAGWEAVKQARALLAADKVLSSDWTPPVLKGVVQEGPASYRAGLVIQNSVDVDNLCSCRASRDWGTICAHSVAVGLHWLRAASPSPAPQAAAPREPRVAPTPKTLLLRRVEEGGEPAELCLILPPHLEPALARGQVMLCLEAQWRGGRTPLNALPKDQAFHFSAQDAALLDQLEALAQGQTPAVLMLGLKELAALLPRLVEHPRLTLGRATPAAVSRAAWTSPLRAELLASGEIQLSLRQRQSPPALVEGGWVFQQASFQPLGLPASCVGVFHGPVRIARPQVPGFLVEEWPRLAASGTVEASFRLEEFTLEPQPPKFLLELQGGLAQLDAVLQCAYGPRLLAVGVPAEGAGIWLPDPAAPTRYLTRDLEAERAALGRLRRVGFTGPDGQGRLRLSGQDQVLNFFAREFPRLQREWQVTLEERLEGSTARNLERIEPRFQITSSGVQWFDLGVVFTSSSGERFSPAEIQRLILSGRSHTRLKNGRLALLDTAAAQELQETLLDCAPQQHPQGYRMSQTQAGFVEATLREHGWRAQAPADWRERAARWSGEVSPECPPLGELEAALRPYQKSGVAWLHFLRVHGFGGILADEMGLGKTLQVLAYLQSRLRAGKQLTPETAAAGNVGRAPSPALVVCPTSLVWNWVAEARRFTPGLRVLALQGPAREALFGQIPQADLVVTSYALLRRDAGRYRDLEFDTVVLDEAQHIKNRQTQNAQAVKAIRSRHRLVLTGTPLENSVLDLWSIFDFLMPGYLGSAADFRERYELPITRDRNAAAQTRLARRLRPFLLRRLKRDVAKDLPARLEQVSFCELTDDQRAVYQQLVESSRREVLEAVGAQGLARSRMVVLNALLRLRQVCCDLRLLRLEGVNPETASGKLTLFRELLDEVLDGGHRVLVFSQFVSMLTLLREHLTAEAIPFCYLDGSTPDRAAVVGRFQDDASVPVFLISLKAGGVGLNLAGADTVIHFDPWWNPAVEDQATDRAHRLGQTRVVTSYKLITKDTVEEKILTLQARKREILQATLGGEEQLAETLTREEIQDLLA